MSTSPFGPGVEITGRITPEFAQILTPEAIALHAVDDLDSKLAVLRGLKATTTAPGFVWARSLDRFVWLAEDATTDPGAELPAGVGAAPEAPAEHEEEPPAVEQKSIW